ncbi:pseudouridylate synthase [Streptomyces sp. TRM66268-LWL]|uniref:RNA pseudouridylate synthase n=1 Tax=Streptomyces polyasparticus TaxID=2767826 RepID=A0ABR7SMA9_9ACTN|nr:pseudouridine synthase [Streptomyces polyasparticus]MBC9715493.1 pseudouridylate synthase [Streptomyces polyasparticus]
MTRSSRGKRSPLPQRDGVDAVRLKLPADGTWATVRDHLVERLAPGAEIIDAMLAAGEFVTTDGPLRPDAPYVGGQLIWFHRELAPEHPVPFPIDVLYQDEHLVVADKPHFLATTPRGSHITQTALARLRTELGLPALSAAHRLDRLTAGVVMFIVRPEERGRYQTLFSAKAVRKEYEAVAPCDPELELPRTVISRIEKVRGVIAASEVPGEPNAESRVELLDHRPVPGHAADGPRSRPALGRYRLLPRTGRTHQLRVHMNSLGLPLLGDPVYPEVLDQPAPDDFSRPLQLLATSLEFTDPVTGREHRFTTRRTLQAWDAYEAWAGLPAATN